jgi:DnaD/phage-associated family protein
MAAKEYITVSSAEELRVLIAAASADTSEEIAKVLGIAEADALRALREWEKRGVVILEGAEAAIAVEREIDTRPSYTGAEVARICAESDVKELIDVCAAILGKTFTPTEMESIIYLYDGLRFDFEYIVRLCKHCHDIGRSSIRYVEKVGIGLYDSGVITVGALEAYIEKEERKNDMEYRVRELFGLGERALTPSEQKYLAAWTLDWNLPFEVIRLAYNEMMRIKDRPVFSYQNGILKKWVENGCKTPEDVAAYIENGKKTAESAGKKKDSEKNKNIGFDLDEFFAAATLRGEDSEGGAL